MPETVREAATWNDLASPDAPPGIDGAPLEGLTSLEVLRHLGTRRRGLTEGQAEARLSHWGENSLPGHGTTSWVRRLVHSARDPFTAVLLCLGLLSAAISSWATACVAMTLVVVSCLLRCTSEYRADRSVAALRDLVATTATVRRRPEEGAASASREAPVDQLVPGDVVRLGPGDLVPADLRLLYATGLTVHQATLTGESTPVAKTPLDVPALSKASALPFDQPHLCFQGSSVVSGSATAVVLNTGTRTRFYGTYQALTWRRRQTRFRHAINGISFTLIRFMLLTPPLVLLANATLRGQGLETLPFAVGVAVALTPEMLPVVVSVALARGAARVARDSEVIVKRLPALHDLGAMDVLCTDKTGTLTTDHPVVETALDPEGEPDPEVLRWAGANSLWSLQLADVPTPDALDEAVLTAADEHGFDLLAFEGVAALPFDPARRLCTAVFRTPDRVGTHTLIVKGSVEEVLDRCARTQAAGDALELVEDARQALLRRADELADEGLRVLALARAERPARLGAYTPADERGLTFVGFVGFRDATVASAADSLAELSEQHVTVKVLTGDHPGTAQRVCRDLGINPGTVVTADRLDELGDAELAELAGTTTLFARCTSQHKARIVTALREAGHTTGFLGDGVNDLAALHAADAGVCPRDAVPVTHDAADMVVTAKDLTAISRAISVGRRSNGNIATYLRTTLSSNLGNVIAMLSAGLLLPFLPMLPSQVLAQNLCFDAAQLAFAFDRPAPGTLRRPLTLTPRRFLRFVTGFGALNAAADLTTFALLLTTVQGAGEPEGQVFFHSGWFTENLLTQAMVMLLLRTGRRSAEEHRAPNPVWLASAALASIGVLLPLSPLAPALGMTALPAVYYIQLLLVLTLYGAVLMFARSRVSTGNDLS